MIEVLDLSQRRKSPSPDVCEPSQVTSAQLIPASRPQNNFIAETPLMLQSQQEAQFKPTTYFPILHQFQPEALRIVKPENLVNLGPNSCETLRFPLHPFGLERPKPIFEPQSNGIEPLNKASGNFSESDDGISDTSSIITSVTTQSKSPSPSTGSLYPKPVNREGKVTRPFKAYPRDPLAIAASLRPTDPESEERYNSFRKRLLDEIHAANGGQPTVTNPKMRRTHKRSSNEALNSDDTNRSSSNEDEYSKHTSNPNYSVSEHCDQSLNISTTSNSSNPEKGNAVKDSAYFERRRKNNAAAKKSRDRRRIKEDEIAIRAAFLERENMELRYELAIIRKQLAMCGVAPPSSLCT